MKAYKLHTVLILVFLLPPLSYGQRVYVEAGFSNASFRNLETNSGASLTFDENPKTQKPSVAAGILFDHFKEILWLNMGVEINNYQINTQIGGQHSLRYDFSYFALKTGVNLRLINLPKLNFGVHGHVSRAWLTQGTREYQNTQIDLLEDDFFYKSLGRYHYGSRVEFYLQPKLELYLVFDVMNSFKKNYSSDETYTLRASSISLGFLFDIKRRDKTDYAIALDQ